MVEGITMIYAPVWKRALAHYIDLVIVSLPPGLFIILVWAQIKSAGSRGAGPKIFDDLDAPAALLWVIFAFSYFVISEAIWGATPGKYVMGIRVIRPGGGPCGLGPALIRNLVRLVDAQICYLVGITSIFLSPSRQRLGDRIARTEVVYRAERN